METAVLTNTELTKQNYALFKEGNIAALLENLAPDVKWVSPGPREHIPFAGEWAGREGVGKFFETVNDTMEFLAFEPREFIEQGNKVVALGYWEGRVRKTGKVDDGEWAMVFTYKNGKVTRFQEFSDTWRSVEVLRK
ncbi:MAG TPA: nuclear transport factor 2 family protein [Flavobacterium sp.]|nr:nuclear transport factor 2 family protein [Flavobacterium sp.]